MITYNIEVGLRVGQFDCSKKMNVWSYRTNVSRPGWLQGVYLTAVQFKKVISNDVTMLYYFMYTKHAKKKKTSKDSRTILQDCIAFLPLRNLSLNLLVYFSVPFACNLSFSIEKDRW